MKDEALVNQKKAEINERVCGYVPVIEEFRTKEEKQKYGDMQQNILEASGYAPSIVQQMLILGTDDYKDTWLQRLSTLSSNVLKKALHNTEVQGNDLAPFAVTALL